MNNLNQLTRKQLATLLVSTQIKNGLPLDNPNSVIKGYLNGRGYLKAQTKAQLIKGIEAYM